MSHFFRRAGFGGRREEIETGLERDVEWAMAAIFEADAAAESMDPLLSLLDVRLLQAWWTKRILEGPPLRERMTLVWHGHFATSNEKVGEVRLMHGQNQMFRSLGLGDFRVLLRAVAHDPAMVLWLDGDSNRIGHPNENFARELLELFALGFGAYQEEDVLEAARAFTGWGTDRGRFLFRSSWHDSGRKTVLGQSGAWNGDEVLDLLFDHPACRRHVARRLLTAFVAPNPELEWVESLAKTLVEQEWNIGKTLEILFASELFFSNAARRARIAAPVELLASVARALGVRPSATWLASAASRMGQALFCPPSVEGWKEGRAWIDVGRWVARHNALVHLVDSAEAERLSERDLALAWPEAARALPVGPGPWSGPRDTARLLTSAEAQLY